MCCNRVIFSASFVCRPVCGNPFGSDVLGTNFHDGCFRHHHHHRCGCRRGWN